MTQGLLVFEKTWTDRQTLRQTRFMFYKYRQRMSRRNLQNLSEMKTEIFKWIDTGCPDLTVTFARKEKQTSYCICHSHCDDNNMTEADM